VYRTFYGNQNCICAFRPGALANGQYATLMTTLRRSPTCQCIGSHIIYRSSWSH
jgi:hypothetical protein